MGTRRTRLSMTTRGVQGGEGFPPPRQSAGPARRDVLEATASMSEAQDLNHTQDQASERDHARIQRDTPPQKKHVGFTRQGSI